MKKKRLLTAIFSLCFAMGIGTFTACDKVLGTGTSDSPSSSVSQESVSKDSTEDGADSASEQTPPTPQKPAPAMPRFTDITSLSYLSVYSPPTYAAKTTLSEQTLSSSNRTVVKGTFNNIGAEVYTGEGGEWVWTSLSIDLPKMNDGANGDLRECALSFDLKVSNCSPTSSISVIDENGERTDPIAFANGLSGSSAMVEKTKLDDNWVHITINLPLLLDGEALDNVESVLIEFSNAFGDHDIDSVFYVDNLKFCTPTKSWKTPTVYNPDGYYSKSDDLYIMFAGNSFIEYSSSAAWLSYLCMDNGANAYVDYVWTPNGRIPDQYANAFGRDGYMASVSALPDVVFIQDFYDMADALEFGSYLEKMYSVSKRTEVKVYPAENETEDGALAATRYGLDLVNWRSAVKTLKADYSFADANLNYLDGALHSNELAGLVGGTLAYMDLYGEIPDIQKMWDIAEYFVGREGDAVVDFLPGRTTQQKQDALMNIVRVCATLSGLDSDSICWHRYSWRTTIAATCENAGKQTGTCTLCRAKTERTIRPLGHEYENNGCIRCDIDVPLADEGDLANLNYLLTIPEDTFEDLEIQDIPLATPIYSLQSNTVSENSTSALTTKFIADGANPLVDAEAPNGIYMSFAALDLQAIYGSSVQLDNATLYFDLHLENCAPFGFTMLLSEQNMLMDLYYLEEFDYTSEAFSFTKFASGWYHCELDISLMEKDYIGEEYVSVMFFFASDGYSDEASFTLDNIRITNAESDGDSIDPVPPAQPDANDWANLEQLSTELIGDWVVHANLTLQKDVVSPDGNSGSAIRGSFHENMTNNGYDSSQDPNGDGGKWVWTAVTIDLKAIYGHSVDLSNQTLFFDVKVNNCDATSSILLLNASGSRSTQIPFNNAFNNPQVSATPGFLKETAFLTDGWARISLYFDKVYANEDHTAVDKIYIIFSNAFGDHVNDSVFYLDNVHLAEGCFLPAEVDKDEWGDKNMVFALEPYNGGASPDLYLQTDVVSQNSTSAWKLDLSTYRASNPNVDTNGNKWGYAQLQFVVLRHDYLNGNYALKNLNNTQFSFDVKNVNVNELGSIELFSDSIFDKISCPISWDIRAENNSAITKTDLGDGWVRIQVEFSGLFLPIELEKVSHVSLVFNNQGCTDTYATIYVDNVQFAGIEDYKETQKDDGDFCDPYRTYTHSSFNGYDGSRLQSDVVSENSTSAVEVYFGTESGTTDTTPTECYFYFVFQTNDATLGGDLQDLTTTTLTFDIKTENVNSCVKFSMEGMVISWEMSQAYPFNLDGTENPYWVSTAQLENGWTRVSLQIFNIYPLEQITAISYAQLTFSNENCQGGNSWVYIDNVKFDGMKISPDA